MHADSSGAVELRTTLLSVFKVRVTLYTVYRGGYEGWFIAQCSEHWQHKPYTVHCI